jgi:hypothetical protein
MAHRPRESVHAPAAAKPTRGECKSCDMWVAVANARILETALPPAVERSFTDRLSALEGAVAELVALARVPKELVRLDRVDE